LEEWREGSNILTQKMLLQGSQLAEPPLEYLDIEDKKKTVFSSSSINSKRFSWFLSSADLLQVG